MFLGSTVTAGIAAGTASWNLSEADAVFLGAGNEALTGRSVASAGDVDNDGKDDILIGAPDYTLELMSVPPTPTYNIGITYLFLGSTIVAGLATSGPPTFGPTNIAPDYAIAGEGEYDFSGCSVASAGDVDNDGFDDILIGAKGHDVGGSGLFEAEGKTYLFLGSSLAGLSDAIDIEDADAYFLGEAHEDESGSSVASAGDVDNDGFDDILIGAPGNDEGGPDSGQSYLFWGSTLAAQLTPGTSVAFVLDTADIRFLGGPSATSTANEDDHSGESVSAAGDIDGDGLGDIVIGAWGNDQAGDLSGKTYVFLGSTLVANTSAQIELSSADTSFIGAAGDTSGWSVASGGDVDADGFDDLIIGGPYNDAGGTNAGTTYLLLSPY